jgi:hypothetical protein
MTEDEAKTKWCPFVRYSAAFDDYASNRWKQSSPEDEPDALNPVACRCIASQCMAWRKLHDADFDSHDNLPGFCGLAGKP